MIVRSPVKPTKSLPGVPSTRRAPTPLRSTPVSKGTTSILTSTTNTGSTATPHEAMVASQQAHINELVQKNRSLEQTIKKLNEDVSKHAADILALTTERKSLEGERKTWMGERQKWLDERKAWIDGCDTMQAYHRIQQYRVACALHDERIAVLKMQEVARMEQVKRLQRDYKITQFQEREAELESQIDEMEELRDQAADVKDRYEKSVQELKARAAVLTEEVKTKVADVQAAHKQYEQVEDDLRRLRETHADATATFTANSSKLTRVTTERDALDAQVTSLKRSLELAQDETTQLRTQLTNWQNLKKGEDVTSDEVRKKKAEIEQELGEARKRIGELETRAGEIDTLETKLQKQKDRTEKLKHVLEEWKTGFEEQTTAREAAETELTGSRTQITTLEQRITELESQLAAASKPKSSSKKAPPLSAPEESNTEPEPEATISPSSPSAQVKGKVTKPASTVKRSSSKLVDAPAKPRPDPRPVKQPDPILEDSDIEILDSPLAVSTAPKQSTKAKAKGKQKAVQDDDRGSDIEMGGVQKGKVKVKVKVKETETKGPTKPKVVKQKKTTTPSDDSDQTQAKTKDPKPKPNSRKRTSPEPAKKSNVKSSRPKDDAEDGSEADVAPKKKKRKINLFGVCEPPTFDWDLTRAGEGLGIPTQLSPMKDTDAVPRRLGRASKG